MADNRYALRVEGVRKAFGGNQVLTSAAIWAEPGRITTLLGRNGCGKTTLLRIAAGLLRPDQGVVALHGTVVERPRLARMAKLGLMFLPQGRLAAPRYTVRAHFAALARVYGSEAVASAIDTAALGDLLDLRVASLSGGEQARLSLGLAFARHPTVLIADEPLVGLAPVDQEVVGSVLRAIVAEGTAIVTSGHDTPTLLAISDVILWSVAGTTHHIGSPEEAMANTQFRREYLGPGFTRPDARPSSWESRGASDPPL